MLRARYFKTVIAALVSAACLVGLSSGAFGAIDFDRLLASLTQRWGGGATSRFNAWRTLMTSLDGVQDIDRLRKVNDFFNRQIVFGDDPVIWGQPDYWATPLETLGKGAGDCEDFVIAKYFSLKASGFDASKLRLIYVRAKTGASDNAPAQAHMVLAYYEQPATEPLILDNLVRDIRTASRRPDLVPVFSFNADGIYLAGSGGVSAPAAGITRLSRWEDLLKRARSDGFE